MFNVVDTEARAREITEYRNRAERQKTGVASARASLESLMNSMKDDATVSELPLVVKGDVQGSVEAITQAVEGISTDEVRANVLYAASDGIS